MVVKIKINLEKLIVAAFIVVAIYLGPAAILDHKINHDFPYGYYASDTFQHQVRADAIKDQGNFKTEPTYISKGVPDIVGRYPPSLYHIAAIFSFSSGIEVFNIIYFIVLLLPIASILIIYFLVREFNKNVALLSLPFSILIYSFPLSVGFLFGHWPSVFSQVFLIVFFWSLYRIKIDGSYFLISASLASVIMAHTSEAVFGFVFLFLFILTGLICKKVGKKEMKVIGVSIVLALLAVSYYMMIFMQTFGATQGYQFTVEPKWDGNPGFYIMDFGILLIPLLIGIIFALVKVKDLHPSLLIGISMLIAGMMNYVGFTFRSFQIRFFWPLYLSMLFGLGIYVIVYFLIKKWNRTVFFLFTIFAIVLFGFLKVPHIMHLETKGEQGIMDPYHWNALNWISENTEPSSKIYFFYGDIYSQDALLRNSKRVHGQVDPDDFIKNLQNRTIEKNYVTEMPGDSGGRLAIWKSPFVLEDAPLAVKGNFFGPQDICSFNYFIFDKVSRQPVLGQYNMIIASKIIEKNAQKVFENEVVVIIKNENVGGNCLERTSF